MCRLQQRNNAQKTAYKKKTRRYGWFTLLWMIVFLPIGFLRMWRSRCRWPMGLKYAISGMMLAALAVVFIAPSPYSAPVGGLELYGDKPEVEVYGPVVPKNYVIGYVSAVTDSGVLPESDEAQEEKLIVYATQNQTHYHLYTCSMAFASGRHMTLYEAYLHGLTPCNACGAPPYVPEY